MFPSFCSSVRFPSVSPLCVPTPPFAFVLSLARPLSNNPCSFHIARPSVLLVIPRCGLSFLRSFGLASLLSRRLSGHRSFHTSAHRSCCFRVRLPTCLVFRPSFRPSCRPSSLPLHYSSTLASLFSCRTDVVGVRLSFYQKSKVARVHPSDQGITKRSYELCKPAQPDSPTVVPMPPLSATGRIV